MTSPKMPLVFRIAAVLLIAATAAGQCWQRQPVGHFGRGFLATVGQACPATARWRRHPTIADTAHALDAWAIARVANLLSRGGRDRCRAPGRTRVSQLSPEAAR
jgi:hypothetical protein